MLPRLSVIFLLIGSVCGLIGVEFNRPDWAIRGAFAAEPRRDEFRSPSPYGDVVSERYYLEQGGEAFMLVRSVYPVAFNSKARDQLYEEVKQDSIAARPGEVISDRPFMVGTYEGRRFLIDHVRARRTKDLRLVLIGSTLYASSYERPSREKPSPDAEMFHNGMDLQPAYANARLIEEMERWRELGIGKFKVKYDASRWYRDPTDQEPGVFNFLRLDKMAEAQLIAENEKPKADAVAIGEFVLEAARDAADSLKVLNQGTKLRQGVTVSELKFAATYEGSTYINHGYFYAGPEGSVQLRAWAPEGDYRSVEGDISEFLEGLIILH